VIEPPAAQEPSPAQPSPIAEAAEPMPAAIGRPPSTDETRAGLLHPNDDASAPERFTVLLQTSVGDLHLDVRRSWAPHSVDRFYTLVKAGYYDGLAFFRVVPGSLAQLGIHGDPAVDRVWRRAKIRDDAVVQTNNRGMVSFVPAAEQGRAAEFIVNLDDNPHLDRQGFAPIGRIREIDVSQRLHAGYGDAPPRGRGPSAGRLRREGDRYLATHFENLDRLKRAVVLEQESPAMAITP
jgi:peptidyl-prolyl cis-trans isomerase A (cyclophilin A)